jgi:hypothetical protein
VTLLRGLDPQPEDAPARRIIRTVAISLTSIGAGMTAFRASPSLSDALLVASSVMAGLAALLP